MRRNTANGEVAASKKLKVPLRASATADALMMKGCPNILSLGKRCIQEGFACEWKSGKWPVLTSADGQSYELDIENYVPVFNASGSSSSSSKDPPAEKGLGGSPPPSGGRPPPPGGRRSLHSDTSDTDSASSENKANILPNHNMTHLLKISTCPVCQRAKAQNTPHRRRANTDNGSLDDELGATTAKVGDRVTADHVALGSFQKSSRRGDTVA